MIHPPGEHHDGESAYNASFLSLSPNPSVAAPRRSVGRPAQGWTGASRSNPTHSPKGQSGAGAWPNARNLRGSGCAATAAHRA